MPSPDDLNSWYQLIFGASPTRETLLFLVGLIIVLFFLIRLLRKDLKAFKEKQRHIKMALSDYGEEYTSRLSEKVYIPAQFQSLPPEHGTDLSDALRTNASQDLIDFYLKRVLVDKNEKHLYLILGGSGMGKSSFAVQLVKKYYRQFMWGGKEPYSLVLIPCGSRNIFERISNTENKPGTALILDALDECNEAIDNFDVFIPKLEAAIEEFHIVIITCRTQFFNKEEEIRRVSTLHAQTRDKGFVRYEHQYIAPFTDEEIDRFLKRKYRFHQQKHKIAKRIVRQNYSLMLRPLLLSYIDDLVQYGKRLHGKADVYRILIERWIAREVSFEQDSRKHDIIRDNIYQMSSELAVGIYNNWISNGGLFLPCADYDALEQRYLTASNIAFHYRGRSLITWDSAGNRKFAHRSFLEYFLADKKIKDASFIINTGGLDDVNAFYSDMCDALLDNEVKAHRIVYYEKTDPYKMRYMSLLEPPQCEYRHLIRKPDFLVIDWNNMTNEMIDWLQTVGTTVLVIKNLRTGAFTNDLINVNSVKAIYFYQSLNPPSQRLQRSLTARKIRYTISSYSFSEEQYDSLYRAYLLREKRDELWPLFYKSIMKY